MTYAELETQLYEHTPTETEALKHLPQLQRYMKLTSPGKPLSALERQFCEELMGTEC